MEKLITYISGRYQKCNFSNHDGGSQLTVGRGYSNDVIVADPYVGKSQIIIRPSIDNDYCWTVKIVDQTNPVLVNKRKTDKPDFVLNSGDEITIGRTCIRFYTEDHDMPNTREFSFANWLHNHKFRPLIASVMLLVLFAVSLWEIYLGTTSELEWGKLSVQATIPLALALIWASAWSLTGWFLKSNHYFFSHLFFSAIFITLLLLLADMYSYFDYIFSSAYIGNLIEWSLEIIIFGLLLGFNIALVSYSPGSFRKGLISSAVLFGSIASLLYLYQEDYDNKPDHSTTVKPSYIPTPASRNIEDYIENYNDIFKTLSSQNNI